MVPYAVLLGHSKPGPASSSCATRRSKQLSPRQLPRDGVKLLGLPSLPTEESSHMAQISHKSTHQHLHDERSWLLFHTVERFHKNIFNFKLQYKRSTSGKCLGNLKCDLECPITNFFFKKQATLFYRALHCGWIVLFPMQWLVQAFHTCTYPLHMHAHMPLITNQITTVRTFIWDKGKPTHFDLQNHFIYGSVIKKKNTEKYSFVLLLPMTNFTLETLTAVLWKVLLLR